MAAVEQAAKTRTDWVSAYIGPLIARDRRNWRKALDAVAPNTPVLLERSGDTSASPTARVFAGSVLPTRSPIRSAVGGAATKAGRLDGRGYEAETIMPRIQPATAERLAILFGEAQQRYARWGVTSIHLMNNDKSLEATLAGLAIAKPLQKWTVYSWGTFGNPAHSGGMGGHRQRSQSKRCRRSVSKDRNGCMDGTPIEQNSLQRVDYVDRPGWRGRSNFTDEQLREILQLALARPTQLALHVVGDAETDRVLKMMERTRARRNLAREAGSHRTWRRHRA